MRQAADWLYGLAAVVILGGAALQAVPEGTWRKYMRMFLGAVVIVTAASPALSLIAGLQGGSFDPQSLLPEDFVESLTGGNTKEWKEEARKKREAALKGPLTALVQEYGFVLLEYSARWDESGQIEEIFLRVREETGRDGGSVKDRETDHREGEGEDAGHVETVRRVETVGTAAKEAETGAETERSRAADPEESNQPERLKQLRGALETALGLTGEQVVVDPEGG